MAASLHASRRARLGLSIALALLCACLLAAIQPASSHALGSCDTWTNASGGNWSTGADWSKGAPPTSTEAACIDTSGTYTVTLAESASPQSVQVGGGASGTQTLEVQAKCGSNTTLSVSGGLSIESNGAVVETVATCGAVVTLNGSVSNLGKLTTSAGDGEGARHLDGSLTNKGTVAIGYNTSFEGAKTEFRNEGAVTVAESRRLTLEDESGFENFTGGSITTTGSGLVQAEPHTSFNEGSGTTSGSLPVLVREGALKYSGTGASTVEARDVTSLSGNIASGQKLIVEGLCGENTRVEAAGSFSNGGAITLTAGSCGANVVLETLAGGTLTNTGSITVQKGDNEGSRTLGGSVTNKGTVTVEYPTTYEGSHTSKEGKEGTFTNEGTLAVPAQLTVVAGNSFVNAAGEIAASGGLVQVEPHASFTEGNGKTTGSSAAPVLVKEGSLAYSGTGASTVEARDVTSLSGNIASGQNLIVEGLCGENTRVEAAGSFSNGGAITLTVGTCGANVVLETLAGGMLTNTGSITVQKGDNEGSRTLGGSVTNRGTVTVEYPTTYEGSSTSKAGKEGTLTNEGTLAVPAQLTVSGYNAVVNAAGEIAASGGLVQVEPHASFTEGNGKTTGSSAAPVLVKEGALTYSGTGASTIEARDSSSLSGNIASGQNLIVEGLCGENTSVKAAGSYSNAGAITLTVGTCGANVVLETLAGGMLTNTGSITVLKGDGEGSRTLGGNLTNKGTVTVEYQTTYEGSHTSESGHEGVLNNEGSLVLESATLTVASDNDAVNAAGKIETTGTGLFYVEDGTFKEILGTTKGPAKTSRPVLLQSSTLEYAGKGASVIETRGSGSLVGAPQKGQTLVIAGLCGDNTSIASKAFKNAGTIELTSLSCGSDVRLALGSGETLENDGKLYVDAGNGEGERAIEGNLLNEKTLYLEGYALQLGGTFAQTTKASFETLIESAHYGALDASGTATIAGKLKLKQGKKYTPAKGATFTILSSGGLTGTFASVSGNKIKKTTLLYMPHYSAQDVTLVVEE